MPTLMTSNVKGAFPDASYVPAEDAIPDSIVLNEDVCTQSVVINGDAPRVLVPYVDETPTASIVAEGAEIGTSAGSLNQISFGTHKIAGLYQLTNESLHYPDATNLISTGAARAITAKADYLFLAAEKDPNGVLPTGIANIEGITTTTVTNLKTVGLDPILENLAAVTDNGGVPSALAMRFSTWVQLLMLKTTDGRPLIAPDVTTSAAPVLFNLPVVLNNYVPENTVLTFSAKDVIVSVSEVETATSDQTYFNYDSSALRLTMRLGFDVIHPSRVGKVVLNSKS